MSKPHYIKAGWLITGSGAAVQKDMLLTVKNGTTTAACSCTDHAIQHIKNITDFSRCTILPPFVDCHVHLAMSGTADPHNQTAAAFS